MEDVDGKGPQNTVGRLYFIDHFLKKGLILFEFFDFLGNIQDLQFMLWKLLLNEMRVAPPKTDATPSGSFNSAILNTGTPERHLESWKGASSSNIMEALNKAGATYKRQTY